MIVDSIPLGAHEFISVQGVMCEDLLNDENHLILTPASEKNEEKEEVNIVLHVPEINRAW